MILIDENDVVIVVGKSYEEVSNGFLINDVVYPHGRLVNINTEDHIVPMKYCYTQENGFYINEAWASSIEVQIQDALDEYTMELIIGGII
jgi:hypothetical protein